MRSQKNHKGAEYLSYLQADPDNEIKYKIIKIKKLIIELGMQLKKSDRDILEKD